MLGNLIGAMDDSGDYQIDVVSPEVSKINNVNRFSEFFHKRHETESDSNIGVAIRFPVV